MIPTDDTAATGPHGLTSFHTCADRLEVSSRHGPTEAPVLLLDTEAPLPALAILMAARARRMYRTLNMLLPAGLSELDATELVDVLHPMAEELQQLAELLQERVRREAAAGAKH